MAKNRSQKKKSHLTHALNKNQKAPIWAYLKTGERDLIRTRKRNWRTSKALKKIKDKRHNKTKTEQ